MPTTDSRRWSKWRRLWRHLIIPSPAITEELQRQQAGLQAGLAVIMLLVGTVVVAIWALVNPGFSAAPYIALAIFVTLLLIYLVSRSRFYRLGTALMITMTMLTVAAIFVTAPGPTAERALALNFLVVTILLASIFLSIPITLMVTGICLLAMTAAFALTGTPFNIAYAMVVFTGVMSALFSLTAAMRNEYYNRLRESQRRYQALFSQSNDGVFILDLEGNCLDANQSAVAMLGYSRNEILGMSFRSVVATAEVGQSENVLQMLLANQHLPIYERAFRRKDGLELPVEINVELARNEQGRPLHIQSIVRDITERKQAERQLKEQQEYLRVLLEQTPVGIITIDLDGHITGANPRSLEILGSPSVSVTLGLNVLSLPSLIEAGISPLLEQALADGQPVETEQWHTTTWHKTVYVFLRAVPHFDNRGRQIGLIIMLEDLTQRVRAEEGMRQMQKFESLGVLAGGVAHDFNNLLVAMLGQTSLALTKMSMANPARPHIEKAVTAADQAARLTQQLLAYSGRGRLAVHSFDLNKLVEDNLHLFSVSIPKHIRLHTSLRAEMPRVEGDISQIQQVVMNLIINAAEALGGKSGTISITTGTQNMAENGHLPGQSIILPADGGLFVTLDVQDDGPGMTPDTVKKIFDPFFTTKEKGHGLGLSAVLGIITGHDGGLSVRTKPGHGTCFRLLLPADSRPVVVAEPVPLPAVPTGGLVLVVDDEEPVREAVTDILEIFDIIALTAGDGPSALELYRQRMAEIDLVLLDLSMPGWSGEETVGRLRQVNPEARIVLSSGYSEAEVSDRFAGQVITGFLKKPYTAEELLDTVRAYLSPASSVN